MNRPIQSPTDCRRVAIGVRGVVQGVGFRPFVYGAAGRFGLAGWVRNEADTVRIEVQGTPEAVAGFCEVVRSQPPPQARIDRLEVRDIPCVDGEPTRFEIRTSTGRAPPRPTIPADLATCRDCLEEIRTPGERRYRYPFTNCTNCGPRWSIIERLPYDRARTSMAGFAMCDDCRREYEDPADRRFHAQPIACPACGPQLRLLDGSGDAIAERDEALQQAAAAVLEGKVLAVKGLGGFQLVVDATSPDAVELLRRRKRRPDKPFALMFASLEEVRRRCELSEREAESLASHEASILLLRRAVVGCVQRTDDVAENDRADADAESWCVSHTLRATGDVAEAVAPGNPHLGVMLPYTPLHHLLMEAVGRPVVCTSGNLSEEPMAIDTEEAVERLGGIADVFLVHDRPIVRPVDDSVARFTADGLQVLRRARGFAPLPIELGSDGPTVLAVGGHLKNAVALALGSQAVLTPHVGDLDNVLAVEVHRRAIRDLVDFFQAVPDAVACDLHPDYASTRHAERLAAEWDVPLVRVQHHHAHVAACAAEHGLEGPMLGFSWDGTGYGPDGTVWGGEVLESGGGEFRRLAHLRTFPLPGGDKAVREPRRSALGVLFEMLGADAAEHAGAWFTPCELDTLLIVIGRLGLCPRTSSMGRLFDAVAAIVGRDACSTAQISFEGQAAMALEFAADGSETNAYPLPLTDGSPAVADWEPLVRAVLADRAAGVPTDRISARFHNALAELAVACTRRFGLSRVVLTGGCFQNALLSARCRGRLARAGFNVYTHQKVPPGDGGIALGQLVIAARRLGR